MRSIFIAFVLLCSPAYADLDDVLDSSVHISTKDGAGSGVVFRSNHQYTYILSAGHVIEGDTEPAVTFYGSGKALCTIAAEVMWCELSHKGKDDIGKITDFSTVQDLAMLRIPTDSFPPFYKPQVMPLGERQWEYDIDEVVCTAGCPKGGWPTAFKGHIISTFAHLVCFTPPIIPGRSGSGVADEKGECTIGIVIWYNVQLGQSTAVGLEGIYQAIERNRKPTMVAPEESSNDDQTSEVSTDDELSVERQQ